MSVPRATSEPDNTALVVVCDRKVIEPEIRELGLTNIEFLDTDGRPLAESSAQRQESARSDPRPHPVEDRC